MEDVRLLFTLLGVLFSLPGKLQFILFHLVRLNLLCDIFPIPPSNMSQFHSPPGVFVHTFLLHVLCQVVFSVCFWEFAYVEGWLVVTCGFFNWGFGTPNPHVVQELTSYFLTLKKMRLAPSKQSRGLKQERRIKEKTGSRFFEAKLCLKLVPIPWAGQKQTRKKSTEIFSVCNYSYQLSVLHMIYRV